jgi:hypothetical protein
MMLGLLRVVLVGVAVIGAGHAHAARGGACGKVDAWLEVIGEWSQGRDLNRTVHGQLRQLIGPAFHAQVMSEIWGGSYASMSDRERGSVLKALNDCSSEPWVSSFLTVPFTNPPDIVKRSRTSDFAQWEAAIAAVNQQPYAALQGQRQQQVAAAERAVQARAAAVDQARANRERAAQVQQERVRVAEAETERRMALVDKHAQSGPFTGEGAAYLNALYADDREALRAYDQMFTAAFAEVMSMYRGSAMDGIARILLGNSGSAQLGQTLQTAAANLSIVSGVAGAYVLYYEHVYPRCMDAEPLVYERTIDYEWVTKNAMGNVLSRSPAYSVKQKFRVNHRFKYLFDHMGDVEKGNAVVTDTFLGRPGAIRLADAMLATTRSMDKFECDSPEMRRLETNMSAYFGEAVRRMNGGRAE